MQQPDLGRQIAALRKSKGWTQDELAKRCGCNIRTLQRIESGSVMPRKYTLSLLSKALDCAWCDSPESGPNGFQGAGTAPEGKPDGSSGNSYAKRVRDGVRDLFNLKKHTMAKVSVLGVIALTAAFLGISSLQKGQAQEIAPDKYKIITNFSGVAFAFPAELYPSVEQWLEDDGQTGALLYRGDTIRSRFGEGVYSLNSRQVVRGQFGDVIIYHPKTLFRSSRLEYRPLPVKIYPSALGSGIVYKVPAEATFRATKPVPDEPNSQEYVLNGFISIKEIRNRIYLKNDDWGEFHRGDTVNLIEPGLFRIGKKK